MDEVIHNGYLKAVKYLGLRARTEFEMRRWLQAKHLADTQIEAIIDLLKQERALNDEKFSHEYVEMGIKYRPQGRLLFFRRMRALGLPNEYIEDALNAEYPREKEAAVCRSVAEKKLRGLMKIDQEQRAARVARYLASRGFREDDIWQALESLGLSS